jgi:DNA-binding LytR/AlgR family response regulator
MIESISVLIVDDEPEARDLLEMLLNPMEGVELAGKAENVEQALKLVMEHDPDLILLDIQMPAQNGFDLVRQLHGKGLNQGFIFVTAFDAFAIDAIRASAFDYLLKPVGPRELENAISRFRTSWEDKLLRGRIDQLLGSLGMGQKLKLNTRSGFLLIAPEDIVCCTADGNYTKVLLSSGRQEVISTNLGTLELMLKDDRFFRISRSGLINFGYLVQVDTRKGTCRLEGETGIELKVSRNRLVRLEALL